MCKEVISPTRFVAEKIRLSRKNRKMSQEELSELLGCSRVIVSAIECSKQMCSIERLYKLCEIFNVPVSYFLPERESSRDSFYVGGVVTLQSGGPPMTILRFVDDEVECQWFNDNKILKDKFKKEVLINDRS